MKIKPISLTQFNKDYGNDSVASLYVLNRSNPNGNIAFNCINELNVTIPVLIPATFIPVDLTTMAPLENLLKSSVLRQIFSKGQLVIIRKEEAEEYLKSPRAKAEYQKLNKLTGGLISGQGAEDNFGEIELETGGASSKSKNSRNEDFLTAIIDRANDEDSDDESIQREFLSKQHVLTRNDLNRLRNEVKRASLIDLVLEALQDLDDEEEEEEDDE